MATESPEQRSDEATLTSAPELTIKIGTDSQNVALDRPHVNGDAPAPATDEFENKHISDIVDDLVNSTEVSISGGSDNEAAKSDVSRTRDDAKGHARVGSAVKKPASFKAVKVNKTFLNPKGSAPGAEAKVGEKASPTISPAPAPAGAVITSRPRLVAKTGSGLITKASGTNGGKAGSAPDANAVWNKNRPAPPPEPKKYTDEELKKYGIHMATRLQPDDARLGQSNWADIDDDDEDWAPETITWKDGTKIALAHTEEPPAPSPEPVARPVPPEKVKSPAPGASPSVKPGVLASGKGLVLKGAPEKPTLVAKPPAPPTPAKSPWATLPKIDKVSPIAVDAPAQTGPRYPPRDAPFAASHAPPPPKEIAADDFSRAPWRDGPHAGNRELFNSQSGRYEPVLDRRGPMRSEHQHPRQPAVLQRQPPHEHQSPIEQPPGGFHAGKNNEQQAPYGRRRGSSIVSGGSGSWQRPRNLEHPLPPPELINARRASMTGASDSPVSPGNFSPSALQSGPRPGAPWHAGASPAAANATLHHPGGQAPDGQTGPPSTQQSQQQPPTVPVTEEDYEIQKRLMHERRELAKRRRQEEEEKEAAARRERIRLKLEALGPAPESNSAKKASAKDAPTPTQIQSREHPTQQKSESQLKERDVAAAAGSELTAQLPAHSDGPTQALSPGDDAVESRSQPQGGSTTQAWAPATRHADRHPAVSWGPQPSAKNVWGAPNNNRTLGNGTFAADLGTSQLPQLPTQSGPGPIAPPNNARAASTAQAAPGGARQPPIGPPRQAGLSRGSGDREMKDNLWAAAVRLDDDKFSDMLNTQHEERDRRLQAEGRTLKDIQPAIKDTWRPTKLDESGMRVEATTKQTLQIGQDNPWATSGEPKLAASQPAVSVPSGTQSEYSQISQSAAPPRELAAASILGAKAAAAVPQARGSRFFPSRDVRLETNRDAHQESGRDAMRHMSPSPPPPDMAGHPAFDGDATHPHVSLPRPQPVVRLPPLAAREAPATAAGTKRPPFGPSKTQAPSFGWAAQTAYKDAEHAPRAPLQKPDNSWQAKIDSLLGGRKVHLPRTGGVDGSGRVSHQPQVEPRSPSELDSSVTTKGMAEECFEEQEMGSLPPIRFPKTVPDNAWQPSPPPAKPLPKKLQAIVSSADPITFPVDVSGAGTVWRVCLPGKESKSITIPFGRTRSNPRRGGQRGGRHAASGQQHRQGRGRDTSSSYSTSTDQGGAAAPGPSNPNSPAHGRNHRGGYRGRENWSRTTPAANQIQT